MKVPFVNYPRQYNLMKEEIDNAINEVLEGGDFILRRHLEEFEKHIAEYVGVKHAIGVNSGTDALFLSLKAAGIKEGDEVITVAHTFVATLGAIVNCGAKPVLVDVGIDHNINPDLIEAAISPRTKAILPVHLNGYICNMGKIMEIADKYNLIVIEDAAQALGSSYKGKMAGSFGLTGCFSCYPAKVLGGYGDGGIVTTDNDEIANRIREMRDNGRTDDGGLNGYGYCSRLDNLQAAILDVKLKHLDENINRRNTINFLYCVGLRNTNALMFPISFDTKEVYQNFPILVKNRDELKEYLSKRGIETLISWPIPLHKQPSLNLDDFDLPVTERISREVLSLPMYPELTYGEVQYVIDTIRGFYDR